MTNQPTAARPLGVWHVLQAGQPVGVAAQLTDATQVALYRLSEPDSRPHISAMTLDQRLDVLRQRLDCVVVRF